MKTVAFLLVLCSLGLGPDHIIGQMTTTTTTTTSPPPTTTTRPTTTTPLAARLRPTRPRPHPTLPRPTHSTLPRVTRPTLPRPTRPTRPHPTRPTLPHSTRPTRPHPTRPTRPHPTRPHPFAWKCSEGPRMYGAMQVDAGMGKVVLSDRYQRAYFLSGSSWYRLGRTSLKHVTVGHSGIWGSCKADKVYKYVGGDFKLARGVTMFQVDAGGHQVVGVRARTYYTYCLKKKTALDYYGRGNLGWTYLRRTMRYYSCGPMFGCWGVDQSYRVWVTKTMSPTNCRTSGWTRVSAARMKMIEVSTDGKVFGLTTTGMIVQRMGINNRRRQGTGWGSVPMFMPVKHLSYDLCNLWVVTTSGMVLKCSH